jgi:hypothetical protein
VVTVLGKSTRRRVDSARLDALADHQEDAARDVVQRPIVVAFELPFA